MNGPPRKLLGLIPLVALIAILIALESPSSGVEPPGACVKEFGNGITGHPFGIAVGPDGKLWFTEQLEDKVGAFDPRTGTSREFAVPKGTQPHGITRGPDGNLWYTGLSGVVGRIDPATGKATPVVTKDIPPGSIPQDIVAAPDGNLYVSLQEAGFVAKLEPKTGKFTLIMPVGIPAVSRPHGMTVDPDRRHLWVALQNADSLARLDLATGKYDKVVKFSNQSGPAAVTNGPGNALYVALQYSSAIGEYDMTSGKVHEYPSALPPPATPDFAPGPKLIDVAADPKHNAVWVTTSVVSKLFRLDTKTKRVERLGCGITAKSGAQSFVKAPDGHLWFTEILGGRLGRLDD
ncbi:MAG: virginiamycin lyase [Thermoleophilaceae bacterium]|jgi:streptogramin lyase|nr:virginiamycin lyase [Thermoleophilaceae bacterium]